MLRVALYASNAIARAGLTALLQSVDLEIVAAIDSWDELSMLLEQPRVDVVLLELPELDSAIAQQLAELFQAIALSMDETEIPGCVVLTATSGAAVAEVLAAGIHGLLPHAATAEEVEGAIAAAASGLMVLHPVFGHALLENQTLHSADVQRQRREIQQHEMQTQLSERELQVLDALSLGLSNRAIATRLYISEHTVKFHISSILAKLQVSGRTEAVAVGIRQGLIKL